MKKLFFTVCCIHVLSAAFAQYKVRFIVKENTFIKRDSVFISGTFNNWDSVGNWKYKLEPYGNGQQTILLTLPPGEYSYKYTGGNWRTVEKEWDGDEIADRKVKVTTDLVINDTVLEWRDLFLKNKQQEYAAASNDTSRLNLLGIIAAGFLYNWDLYNVDSALHYTRQTFRLLEQIKASAEFKSWKGYSKWLFITNELNASLLHNVGNFSKSLELRLENLKLAESGNDLKGMLSALPGVVNEYVEMKDYDNALQYAKRAEAILSGVQPGEVSDYLYHRDLILAQLAICYYSLNNFDSALYYGRFNYNAATVNNDDRPLTLAASLKLLGDIHRSKNNLDSAFFYYRSAIPPAARSYATFVTVESLQGIALLFQKMGRRDSALLYAKNAFATIESDSRQLQIWGQNKDSWTAGLAPILAEIFYANNEPDSAYKYLLLSVRLKEKLFNAEKVKQVQNVRFNESLRQIQADYQNKAARTRFETRLKLYTLIAGLVGVLLVAFILYRNNKQKHKANALLQSQKNEIETTLNELRITQGQLIQAEKMASLGELTAGIAHEIQNPLNFVNNFSDVNSELIDDANLEIDKGNVHGAKAILNDIKENETKIKHHGKRADAIVKGMLQHSRTSIGQKELTDINTLCDEFLRLAYHGLRAKDKSFNAITATDFDPNIGKVRIITQDIGRVILNLVNNAFYAVNEKQKENLKAGLTDGYHPTVKVSTTKQNGSIEIKVKDNGHGIPQKLLDKIFQPFFTTKPTGQGTGLGLSLAYDIVKAHGGEIKIETKEGEGSEFTIELPVSKNS